MTLLTNITAFNETANVNMTAVLAARRIKYRELAFDSLQDDLALTPIEAAKIVDDPVYSDSDLRIITAITSMLKKDLLSTVNSFFADEMPTIPTYADVINRLVARFPEDPVVFNANSNNPSIYENGHTISKGLVRRLVRGKKFREFCEEEIAAALDFYSANARYVEAMDLEELPTFMPISTMAMRAQTLNSKAVVNPNKAFLEVPRLDEPFTVLLIMAVFGVGICGLTVLRAPKCLRTLAYTAKYCQQGCASVFGLFKNRPVAPKKPARDESPSFYPAP